MSAYKARKLIGSKSLKKITPDIFHKLKVIDRKREICKVKCDIDNGLYEPDEQILPSNYRGTHLKKSILSKIIKALKELLP